MRYVIAGYVVVLGLLFLYAVQLTWRRRRLSRAVARAVAGAGADTGPADAAGPGGVVRRDHGAPRTASAPPGPGDPAAGPPPADRPPVVPVRQHHTVRYVVVGLVLVGALAFLLVKGLGSALDFYLPADQAVAQKAQLGDKTFNLEGVVEPGSIHSTGSGVDFVVTSGATRVTVDNSGQSAAAVPGGHPGDRRGPLRGRPVRLGPDPGEALGDLHRPVPVAGDRTEREQAVTARVAGPGPRPAVNGTLGHTGVLLGFVAAVVGMVVLGVGLVRGRSATLRSGQRVRPADPPGRGGRRGSPCSGR